MPRLSTWTLAAFVVALVGCGAPPDSDSGDASSDALRAEASAFLSSYEGEFQKLYYEASQAQWASNTRIVEGDDTNARRTEAAEAAVARFTGSVDAIETTRRLLEGRDSLEPLQVKQLEQILYLAANNPQTVADLVEKRIAAETAQVEALYGFDFQIDGKSVTTNEIDDLLVESTDLDERLKAWEASKAVGANLRDGLVNLVELRNETVRALGYEDYFDYQVSDYGMTVDEMMELNRRIIREVWPLYRELHTWARYELAERYGADVPDLLPAHWLPNRWSQEWAPMVEVEGLDLDSVLAEKDAEWVIRQAEAFYVGLGFPSLPESFWERSSLYPLPPDADYKKNNHASAWHLNLEDDIRCLMSVEPNESWWTTTHHELGHIYYYIAYSRPEVPLVLRAGANRAFHEGVGSLLGIASTQRPYLEAAGLVEADAEVDEAAAMQKLLKEALDTVVFLPWSSGTMTHFEHDLYRGHLAPEEYNARWWEHVRTFQGVEPPGERSAELCDAATKTHINDDAAQYYDYALSFVILHQLHDHISTSILQQDPRATNYRDRTEIGDFLQGILEQGATRDWREVLQEAVGSEISAKPMLDYYAPLLPWLQEQNAGREATLPEEPVF